MARGGLLCLCVSLLALVAKPLDGQVRDSSRSHAKAAVLRGIVKDEYGDPLQKAEVRVQPGGYVAQTDTTGQFQIEAPAGQYNVVFRRLGYIVEDFSWRARPGEGTQLSIRLNPLPQTLDTVVVRDSHDRVAGASWITGVVVDSAMQPLKDVELQLIGTGRHAVTYERGEFFFAGLAKGSYVLRARRIGFNPGNLTIKIGNGEEHGVTIKLTPLPFTLATVEVRDMSGFGSSADAWQEFDRRQRWKSNLSVTIGRDVFTNLGKMPLDGALRGTQAESLIGMPQLGSRYVPTSIHSNRTGGLSLPALPPIPGDVCVLVDGVSPYRVPLSVFRADEVERVEVFAANGDWTGTIGARMEMVKGCETGPGLKHPPYFVIWMRGSS